MLHLNAPPIKTSACHWDEPQSLYVALRYRGRIWPLQAWFGERLTVEITDSKHPKQRTHIMSLGAWDRFVRRIHDWRPDSRGQFRLGRLRFTAGEVAAFVDGVDAGDFHRAPVGT